MTATRVELEDIVSLCKRRGFIYQGSEVYGGLSGTWDYGPLGVALKRNIMNLWWKTFVQDRDDMYGVDAAILMNQKVWQASGHTETFNDPLVDCKNCLQSYRVDKIISSEAVARKADALQALQERSEGLDESEKLQLKTDIDDLKHFIGPVTQLILNETQKCSKCGNQDWHIPQYFNMMLKTVMGPKFRSIDRKRSSGMTAHVEWFDKEGRPEKKFELTDGHNELGGFMFYGSESVSYLRPETAQGIFTNYKNVLDSFYPDLPFGIAQQGKAFRNEISPRDFVFRSREFEQMEIEYFVHPDKWQEAFEALLADVHAFLKDLGLPDESIHELEVPEADRAHYSKRTIDIEFDYPIGREELMGIAYRTDFDLKNIHDNSGRNMEYTVKGTNERFIPHVIEPSFGVERALMAVLTSAYREDEPNGEKRIYLALPEHLAPVKFAVSPLLKNKPELVNKARAVYAGLKKKHGAIMWDDNGNIGKRYRRQDEIGTPSCVVIDFQTLEDDTVTVRDRDTTEQTRVAISELI